MTAALILRSMVAAREAEDYDLAEDLEVALGCDLGQDRSVVAIILHTVEGEDVETALELSEKMSADEVDALFTAHGF